MLVRYRPIPLLAVARLLLGALVLISFTPSSFANELRALEQLLARPAARAVLETVEGRALLDIFAAEDARALTNALSRSEYAGYRAEVQSRLREAEELVARARQSDPARAALDAEAPLSVAERRVIEFYTGRALRLGRLADGTTVLAGRESRIAGEAIDFTGRGGMRSTDFVAAEDLFLRPSGPINLEEMLARVPETTGAVARARGERGVRGFFRRMSECTRNRPPDAESRQFVRYLAGDIAIAEAFTIGGYVNEVGLQNVRMTDLTTDIATTAVMKVISNSAMRSRPGTLENTTFRAQWIRSTTRSAAVKFGRVGIDATIFFLNPIAEDDTPEGEREHHDRGMERLGFNAKWAAATAPITASVFQIVQGLSCLGAQHGWRWVGPSTFLGRIAIDGATTLIYFHLRESPND